MAKVAVVLHPFGGHQRGDRISDATDIANILKGEQATFVVISNHPDASTTPSTTASTTAS